MNNNMLAGFERLVRETHKSEAELMTLAFRAGVRQLWRERQQEAMLEDLEWALKD